MRQSVTTALDALMAKGIVGASAAIVGRGGDPVIVCRGLADRASGVAVTPNHIFKIGSCTKTFVAATLLRLVQGGAVAAEAPIARWFPTLPQGDRVTVLELVNHRSGLPEFEFDMPMTPGRVWTPRQVVELAFAVRRPTAPGIRFAYSNTGYVLAGMLIEALTGGTLAAAIRTQILAPLGLADSWAAAGEAFPADRLVHGYYFRPPPDPAALDLPVEKGGEMWQTGDSLTYSEDLQDSTALFPFSGAYAAGDMVSTAADLARFLDGLFGGRLLAPETLAIMAGNRVEASFPGTRMRQSGAGLFAMEYAGRTVLGHQGSMPGYVTVMAHVESAGVSAALMTNTGSGNRFSVYAAGLHETLDAILAAALGTAAPGC